MRAPTHRLRRPGAHAHRADADDGSKAGAGGIPCTCAKDSQACAAAQGCAPWEVAGGAGVWAGGRTSASFARKEECCTVTSLLRRICIAPPSFARKTECCTVTSLLYMPAPPSKYIAPPICSPRGR
jgi:hypothetical protein